MNRVTGPSQGNCTCHQVSGDSPSCPEHRDEIREKRNERALDELATEAYAIAKSKGWHDKPNPVDRRAMLIITEVSELYEAYRDDPNAPCDKGIPITAAEEELADVVIRCLDFAIEFDLRIGAAVRLKMAYNRTRPHKHGGKKF